MIIFELFIPPNQKNKEKIEKNLLYFFKYKNYFSKSKVIIYTTYEKQELQLKKYQKINIEFVKINQNIKTISDLWFKYSQNYHNVDWIIHYNLKDRLLEFDFIKMILKKIRNTFVKKSPNEIYDNLFCINTVLLFKFIQSKNKMLTPDFIIRNTLYYNFPKYMNIISKTNTGTNIYI